MKPKIGFMGQLATENILDDLNFAVENGFDYFEIGLDWEQNFNLKPWTITQIKSISEKNDLSLIVHTAWYLPTSTIIPEIARVVIKIIKKGILLATKVNADRVTVHPGFKEMPKPASYKNYRALIRNLKEIVNFGKRMGVMIGLENFNKNPCLMCNKVNDLLEVVNSVDGLKVVFDVGHANTTGIGPVEYFKRVKEFVINMHVHDNKGEKDEHLLIGEGTIDFVTLLRECKNSKYYGPFILELFPNKNILEGKKRFLDFWNKA